MTIRKATLSDLDRLSTVEEICFPPEEACSKERFIDRLTHYGDHFLLLYKDNELVSFIDGLVSDERTLTDEMYEDASLHDPLGDYQMIFGVNTLPEYRNRGYGGLLIEAMIDLAKEEGRKGVILTCKDNMVHYYEEFGFTNEGRSDSTHGGETWYQMFYAINE